MELYTSNLCPRCKQAQTMLRELIDELGPQRYRLEIIDVVEHIDRSVEQGILRTPSLVIDRQLIGALPDRHTLKKQLQRHGRQ